jgi:hypothetical protein
MRLLGFTSGLLIYVALLRINFVAELAKAGE